MILAQTVAAHTKVHSLDLTACGITGQVVEEIAQIRELRKLFVNHNNIRDQGAIAVAPLIATSATLTELRMAGCNIGVAGVTAVAQALSEPSSMLKMLDLSCNNIDSQPASKLFEALRLNTNLRELYLNWNEIGDEGVMILAKDFGVNSGCGGKRIGHKGGLAIGTEIRVNTVLQVLDLSQNCIGAEGACCLLKALDVKELDLSWNNVGESDDVRVQPFISALKTTKVWRLNLENSNLGDDAVDSLAESVKDLKDVMLDDNSKITKIGVKRLLQAVSQHDSMTEVHANFLDDLYFPELEGMNNSIIAIKRTFSHAIIASAALTKEAPPALTLLKYQYKDRPEPEVQPISSRYLSLSTIPLIYEALGRFSAPDRRDTQQRSFRLVLYAVLRNQHSSSSSSTTTTNTTNIWENIRNRLVLTKCRKHIGHSKVCARSSATAAKKKRGRRGAGR